MLFGYLTLFTALILSLSAAVYSILGLTAIFAAAFWPIVIMGGSLEVGKIVATLWLHKYWKQAGLQYKAYLCFAVAILMFLTSMGVFGFLSKAHSDQSLVSGDAGAKLAIYDEKIKISRDNIDANRRALTQMDAAVDQVMGRSTDEKGADKAVQIRRSQANERSRLLKEIEVEQRKITTINEERAPLAAENRKIEAEVGPIKYIAALIYGDNPDTNVLEKSVRWVIILIVIVFDPLALTLLLAATKSIEWERGVNIFNLNEKKKRDEEEPEEDKEVESWFQRAKERARFWDNQPKYEADDGPLTEQQIEQLRTQASSDLPQGRVVKKTDLFPEEDLGHWDDFFKGKHSFQDVEERIKPEVKLEPDPLPPQVEPHAPGWMFVKPTGDVTASTHFGISEPVVEPVVEPAVETVTPEPVVTVDHSDEDEITQFAKSMWLANNPGADVEAIYAANNSGEINSLPWHDTQLINDLPISDGERKRLLEQAAKAQTESTKLVQTALQADNAPPLLGTVTGFGIEFPKTPNKGDMFLRVDQLPTVLYKYNGAKWIEVDKSMTDSYAYDDAYIDHLINKIASGEYDLDLLSDIEREQIALRLKDQQ
jgi:hypothetical protein